MNPIKFNFAAPTEAMESALSSVKPWVVLVCFLVSLAAYFSQVWRKRYEPTKSLEAIGVIAITVMFSAALPLIRPLAVGVLYWPAETLAQKSSTFHLERAVNAFTDALELARQPPAAAPDQPAAEGTTKSVARFVWNLAGLTKNGLLSIVIQTFVYVLTVVAAVLVLPFYFLQHALVPVFFTFMPIAICGIALPFLRDRCVAFICMTLSVLLWPLGFSLVAAAVNLVFVTPIEGGVGTFADFNVLRAIVAAVLMIFGTLLVPPTMFYLTLYGGTNIDPIMSAVRSLPRLGGLARR